MESSNAPRLGAPTKYRDDIPEKLLEYFSIIRVRQFLGKDFPEINTIEGFCARIKIAKSTFHEWVKKYPELSNAYSIAKNWQADQLFFLTSNRIIESGYGKLLTVNCTDMSDKIETKHEVSDNTMKLAYALKDE